MPASVNVIPLDAPPARLGVVHDLSDLTVAVCCALSLLVHVTVSPTFAVIVGGSKAKFAIVTLTVPAVVDGAHAPAAADGAVVAVALPQAAAMSMIAAIAAAIRNMDRQGASIGATTGV